MALLKTYTCPHYTHCALVIAIALASGIQFGPPSVSAQVDNSTLEVYSGSGNWKGMFVQSPDPGSLLMAACAMEVRMEGLSALDKTAWNGLKIRFCPFGEVPPTETTIDEVTVVVTPPKSNTTEIVIWYGNFGEWQGWKECPDGMYINGAEIRFDEVGVDLLDDDIGANGLKMQCVKPTDPNATIILPIEDGYYGSWKGMASKDNQLVCGAEVQYHDPCGVLCDDTALNGLRFKMCDIPNQP